MQLDALVEDGVGLAAEHLDGVAEVDQRLGEVAGVHALAADVRLAAVGEIGDRERGVWRQGRGACRGDGRHRSARLSARCYRLVSVTGLQRGVPPVTSVLVSRRWSWFGATRRLVPDVLRHQGEDAGQEAQQTDNDRDRGGCRNVINDRG